MRLEYFQLIDRIVGLDLDGQTITAQAQVPETSTIFEGHFPGHPLMPGVLLIEAMAQTSRLADDRLSPNFDRMPFLAAVKEGKTADLRDAGTNAVAHREPHARRLRLRDDQGRRRGRTARRVADSEITFRVMAFPDPQFRASMTETA